MASTIRPTLTTVRRPHSTSHSSLLPSQLFRNRPSQTPSPSSAPSPPHRWPRGGISSSASAAAAAGANARRRHDAAPPDGLPSLRGHRTAGTLPPLPLRLQVLRPPAALPRLLQLRPRHPLMAAPAAAPLCSDARGSDESAPSKTVRVVIKGRVQGVFYRNWTVNNASQLGLKGWVRNRRGGSVEALFSGKPESVDEMEQRCRRGPPAAVVTGLQVFPSTDDPGNGFEHRPTV